LSILKYGQAPNKDSAKFDDFMADFFDAMTNIQDPEDADGTLADITTKFNNLLASLREQGLMR
jgi:hypothetical protein